MYDALTLPYTKDEEPFYDFIILDSYGFVTHFFRFSHRFKESKISYDIINSYTTIITVFGFNTSF
jgi:hypothetical protein